MSTNPHPSLVGLKHNHTNMVQKDAIIQLYRQVCIPNNLTGVAKFLPEWNDERVRLMLNEQHGWNLTIHNVANIRHDLIGPLHVTRPRPKLNGNGASLPPPPDDLATRVAALEAKVARLEPWLV